MKIYPQEEYSIELYDPLETVILKLKSATLAKNKFVSNWNNQLFIGTIEKDKFEINLSKKVSGNFFTLKGEFHSKKGTLEIKVSDRLKLFFVTTLLFILIGIIIAIYKNKLEVLAELVLSVFIIRYLFLELAFNLFSKIILKKLKNIVKIKKLEKIDSRNT